ncbi:MAG: hypothetical protein H0W78_03470 [Planctomycetes bacterium]|nr:hypothetical protein [Planctomycetota bacterium]
MSSTKAPAVVDPKEWVSRTSQTISPRSSALRAVDAAYEDWYKNSLMLAKQRVLLAALDGYLKENGLYWNKVTRNNDSNGQMAYIHGLMKEAVNGTKPHALQNQAIPHTRYGVLYLLGNTTIDVNWLNAGLEGLEKAIDIATAGMGKSLQSTPVGNIGGQSVSVQTTATVGNGLLAVGRKAGVDTPVAQRADHRNFIVNESKPTAMNQFGFPMTRKALELASDNLLTAAAAAPLTLAAGAVAVIADLFNNVRLAVQKAVTTVMDKLKAKMLADGTWCFRTAGAVIRKVIVVVVNHIMGEVVPFLKEGLALGHHLAETIQHVYTSIELAWMKRSISINPGHPEMIAHTIQMQMLKEAGKSFLNAAGEAVKMGLKGVAAGAGHLAAAILSAIAWMVKFIMRICEVDNIHDFLSEARGVYAEERKLAKKVVHEGTRRIEVEPNMDPKRGGYIHDLKKFKAFFQRGCDASAVIPMLTLNSGICGSLMTFIQMYKGDASDAQVIEQKTFNAGNDYFLKLKALGSRYMRSKGFKFSSHDPAIGGYLVHALRDHQIQESKLSKALAFI